MSCWAMRNASSSGRAEPADMMCVPDSSRGHGQGTPLSRSTTRTVFIAHQVLLAAYPPGEAVLGVHLEHGGHPDPHHRSRSAERPRVLVGRRPERDDLEVL